MLALLVLTASHDSAITSPFPRILDLVVKPEAILFVLVLSSDYIKVALKKSV